MASKFKSEKEWFIHSAEVRKQRDQSIAQYLEISPFSKAAREFPEKDKSVLQKMNVTQLREFILSTQFDETLHKVKHGLSRNYSISQILAILLERTLDVGFKLEALADINFDQMFDLALQREKELSSWTSNQKTLISQGKISSYDDNSIGLLFGVPISIKDSLKMKGNLHFQH